MQDDRTDGETKDTKETEKEAAPKKEEKATTTGTGTNW